MKNTVKKTASCQSYCCHSKATHIVGIYGSSSRVCDKHAHSFQQAWGATPKHIG
jgi:hypothetical protein